MLYQLQIARVLPCIQYTRNVEAVTSLLEILNSENLLQIL